MTFVRQRRHRMVVVGESPDTNELFEHFFGGRGFDIATTFDASVAVSLAMKQGTDVLLLDVSMEVARLEQLRSLAREPALASIPIVSTLPFTTREGTTFSHELGARFVQCRQWNLDALHACIVATLSSPDGLTRRVE